MASSNLRRMGLGLFVAVLFSNADAQAQAPASAGPPVIATQVPAGFENLVRPQNMLVDLFYGGRKVGEAMALYEPGRLTFRDPATVARLLPRLKQPAEVARALSGPLAAHPELVCTQQHRPGCGTLSPEVAGVIFDESRFRADLFVSPERLEQGRPFADKYLPPPQAGLSLADTVGGAVAGSSRDSTDYNFQNRAVLGYHEGRFRTDFGYTSDQGFLTDSAAFEIDKPAVRYTGGLFWVPGLDLIGQRRIYGVGAGTQTDTRADHDQATGNALVVFLQQRSQVEILRDGRLLSSRFYEAGNQILDTSDLPEGSYYVVLRIREAGDGVREERRFFVKNSLVPLPDQPVYFAYIGGLADENSNPVPAGVTTPFAEAGGARRVSDSLAIDFTAIGTDQNLVAEPGSTWFSDLVQVRAAALGSIDGDLGLLINANSTNLGALSFGLDARRIWGSGKSRGSEHDTRQISFSPIGLSDPHLVDGDETQISGRIGYQWGTAQLGLLGAYQKQAGNDSTYSIGPSVYWPLWRNRDLTLTLIAQATQSNSGSQVYAGLRLQFDRPRLSVLGEAGVQGNYANGNDENQGTGAVGRVFGKYTEADVLDSELSIGAGIDRTMAADTGRVEGEFRGAYGDYSAGVEHDFDGDDPSTRYGASFLTGVAATTKAAAVGGENATESAIVVRLEGPVDEGRFEVLVNGSPQGRVTVGHQLPIFLTPYRKYSVRIMPVDAPLADYDTGEREFDLYPGNVQTLVWNIQPIVAVYGRAVTADGRPVADARIEGAHGLGATDGKGYFQVEIPPRATLTLVAGGSRPCRVEISALKPNRSYASLGTVVCR